MSLLWLNGTYWLGRSFREKVGAEQQLQVMATALFPAKEQFFKCMLARNLLKEGPRGKLRECQAASRNDQSTRNLAPPLAFVKIS